MKHFFFTRHLKILVQWLHAQEKYWAIFKQLPAIEHPKYAFEVEQQLQSALGGITKLEPFVQFLDVRIAEFEKKMLYHDEFDTLVNRARLSELVFLRKRILAFMDNNSIAERKKVQQPFTVMHKERKSIDT